VRALRRPIQCVGLLRAGLLILVVLGIPRGDAPADDSAQTGDVSPSVSVRILEPAPPGLILGETRVTVEATAPAGARITSVELYIDGALLARMEKPPYSLTWNAGTRFTQRVIRAVATDSAGRTGEAILRVRPLFIGQYEEVRLVTLYATVRNERGEPVLDLKKDDFLLFEDGVPQSISHFTASELPLVVALLVDSSNSMSLGGRIDLAKKAAEEFVDSVAPEDRLMVVDFNDDVRGLDRPIADRRRLKEAIGLIHPAGGTALYDAVFRTAATLGSAEGRRAIVLLSDGRDQAFTENEPGSLHLFEEALANAHRNEVAIYSVGLGAHLENEMDLQLVRSLREILETFARETGGRSYFPERAGQLSGIYRQIAADLKHQYALAYTPASPARDGRWHALTLRTTRPGLEVRSRSGYYAPAP
jgi:Ca-activated chloride channel homolog